MHSPFTPVTRLKNDTANRNVRREFNPQPTNTPNHMTPNITIIRKFLIGTIMAATVLNSQRAIEMSVFVVRAFVRLRELLATNCELAEKVTELDRILKTHDSTIRQIIEAIKELTSRPSTPRRQIGFQATAGSREGQKP